MSQVTIDPSSYTRCPHEHIACACPTGRRKHNMANKEKIGEVIKWLYINDRQFDTSAEWKEALISKLKDLYE